MQICLFPSNKGVALLKPNSTRVGFLSLQRSDFNSRRLCLLPEVWSGWPLLLLFHHCHHLLFWLNLHLFPRAVRQQLLAS